MRLATDLRDYSKTNYLAETKRPPQLAPVIAIAVVLVAGFLMLGVIAGVAAVDHLEALWTRFIQAL